MAGAARRGQVMSEVFVDTSAWYPLVVRSHPDHARLSAALRTRIERRERIVTSNLVVAESHALIMRRAGIGVGLRFLQLVRASPNVVVTSTESLEDAAVTNWITRFSDKPFSLVDAVSFAIMAERGTRSALTLDRHFAAAGYEMVTG
ncbi:MAG: type II toxin-antitoxin system VapC family toxin [Gemmatimonadetes bacterium]|nr:type II toxin-antitoxin system VapC family toxin [Gemmatimonadota bacterium]